MGNIKETIAKNILFYRKKRKMSQKELAGLVGVNNSAISNWENGINSIDIDTLFRVCNALEISVNAVFGVEAAAQPSLSTEHQELISAYEQADLHHKNIVRMTLGLKCLDAEAGEDTNPDINLKTS